MATKASVLWSITILHMVHTLEMSHLLCAKLEQLAASFQEAMFAAIYKNYKSPEILKMNFTRYRQTYRHAAKALKFILPRRKIRQWVSELIRSGNLLPDAVQTPPLSSSSGRVGVWKSSWTPASRKSFEFLCGLRVFHQWICASKWLLLFKLKRSSLRHIQGP